MNQFRVGIGNDQHAVDASNEKPLVLGGVKIPNVQGVKAHSDGDLVLHALFNAISSAMGGRSIGYYYNDKDPANKGMNSAQALQTALKMARDKGFRVNNASIAIECKAPKIEPHSEEIKQSLSKILQCNAADIGITASTGEGLSAYGKGEGIFAQALVSLIADK